MLIVTGYMHVEPSELVRFEAELQALIAVTRQRAGNLFYDAVVADPQAGRLLIAERWRDQAALTAHLEAADTAAFIERWQHRMRGDIRKYDASNGRELMAD
jgi:quinol monooxygenase YgiN